VSKVKAVAMGLSGPNACIAQLMMPLASRPSNRLVKAVCL